MNLNDLILISEVADNVSLSNIPDDIVTNFMLLVQDGKKYKSERDNRIKEIREKAFNDYNVIPSQINKHLNENSLTENEQECINKITILVDDIYGLYENSIYANQYPIHSEHIIEICKKSNFKISDTIIFMKMLS